MSFGGPSKGLEGFLCVGLQNWPSLGFGWEFNVFRNPFGAPCRASFRALYMGFQGFGGFRAIGFGDTGLGFCC